MWQDKVKEIIYILENSNVNEIEVTFWGKKIRVLKSSPNVTTNNTDKVISTNKVESLSEKKEVDIKENNENYKQVLSPMPGVFYSSQSPEKPPYVSEGDTVTSGQVICIIESMKIMNEIESEYNGVIKKILMNNSDPVEFNQPLFIIEPS
ncbi:MAG: acetyl-CoA carboxylase, biotin carboxyl carrier protein [bacterium TMED217]|nr:MAG: acetyl-CoA carboxylase, biotin carboxyl carrier protein [bacterium TMED217]|tara:strand:+ start:10126 stop:10575 length:450 start_codon:yes stop_codon:yes gene_type:complete